MRLKLISKIEKVLKEKHKACMKFYKEEGEFLDRWGMAAMERRKKCKSCACRRKCLEGKSIPKELLKEGVNKESSSQVNVS